LAGWQAKAALAVAVASLGVPATASARTWFVSASAGAGGNGSLSAPFASLAAVEAVSGPNDRIVVLAAPAGVPPLDGGIALKPGQELIGDGPPVGTSATSAVAPRLTNTNPSRLDGDAVRLASHTTVRNLEISGSARGAIYGNDVGTVRILNNDVSGQNTSCTVGLQIPPFSIPLLSGGSLPAPGLPNGWAGIMVDTTGGESSVKIVGNRVHNATCGDGIDLRVFGTGSVRALIADNDVFDLQQGASLRSVLGIGLQTNDHGQLDALVDRNHESGLGNPGVGKADDEGLFVIPIGPSSIRARISRNVYTGTPGRGGISENGLEFVSFGDGAHGVVHLVDSTFSGSTGDVIEEISIGKNSDLRMTLDRVVATGSTGPGDTRVLPANNGDCLIVGSSQPGSILKLTVRHSLLTNCANNGLTLASITGDNSQSTKELSAYVSDSVISGNHGGNVAIYNYNGLESLKLGMERVDLSNSHGAGTAPANFTAQDRGTTSRAIIDLGGGPLESLGGACLGGGPLAVDLVGYDAYAQHAWWGQPGGPSPERVHTVDGTLDASQPLAAPPSMCADKDG